MRRAQPAGRRVAAPPQAQRPAAVTSIGAPLAGWVSSADITNAPPGSAVMLENWFPERNGVRVRRGCTEYVDTGDGNPITSLFTYKVSGVAKLFAADSAKIWDVTTSTPSAVVTGQTGGEYSTAQLDTGGGQYLIAVNGEDSLRRYDGSSWVAITGVSSPAITNVTTANLSHVWAYKHRLYFIEKGTMSTWYLPLDSVSGAATEFALSGIMQGGGELMIGATWSIDAGDGIDDKWVVVTDQGEVAIYEGDDPDADNWVLAGRYRLAAPLGKNAVLRVGGDLLIATVEGLVPLSQVLQRDPANLSLGAISRAIENEWIAEAAVRRSMQWSVVRWDEKNMAMVALPTIDDSQSPTAFVLNVETGAWAKWTGWDMRSLAVHDGNLFYGTPDGRVMQGEAGGSDDGAIYVCRMVGRFENLGAPLQLAHLGLVRTIFRAAREFNPQISCSVNYAVNLPSPPSASAIPPSSTWDSAVWDESYWDADISTTSVVRWRSVAANGFAVAPQIQVTFGSSGAPDAMLARIDLVHRAGGAVTT